MWTVPVGHGEMLLSAHILPMYKRRQGHKPLMLNMSFGMYRLPIVTVSCSIAGSFIFFVEQLGFTMNVIFSI